MIKILSEDKEKNILEAKEVIDGLTYKGMSYSGICSDKGIKLKNVKGKSVQNVNGGGSLPY